MEAKRNGSNPDGTNGTGNVLEQNCYPQWPKGVCIFANICGLISMSIWFVVLFPQIWKNYRRRSVKGLSVLWATANFSASLINLFFVYGAETLPLYVKVSAIYQPCLEFIILLQFVIYGREYNRGAKLIYGLVCLAVWVTLALLEVLLNIRQQLQWAAIVLWCIETFPQVMLNMKLRSTSGQSTYSVALTLVGKTTDFLSNYLLVMPLQFIIMTYFSSSMAYINGIQVAYYRSPYEKIVRRRVRKDAPLKTTAKDSQDSQAAKESEDTESSQTEDTRHAQMTSGGTPTDHSVPTSNDIEITTNDEHSLVDEIREPSKRNRPSLCRAVLRVVNLRRVVILILVLVLCVYTVGLVWKTGTVGGLLCPASIAVILVFAYSFIRHKSFSPNAQFMAYM